MDFLELVSNLKDKPYFEDIGIHIVKENYLYPFWKKNSNITIEEWKEFHRDKKMKINEDKYLLEMVRTGEAIFIDKVKDTDPDCLLKFGIKSTNLIPIKNEDIVIGFVTMPIFKKYYKYSEEDKVEIIKIIKDNEDYIKETILCIEQ